MKPKMTVIVICCVLVALFCSAGPAQAENPEHSKTESLAKEVSLSFSSNFRSRYVSFGIADSEGWVWQPFANIEWKGIGFNVWGNLVMEDKADRGTFNEVDLTAYYDINFHNFNIHPYFTVFLYPTDNKFSLDYSSYSDVLPSLYLSYFFKPFNVFINAQFYTHPTPWALRSEMGLGFTEELPMNFGINSSGLVGFDNSRRNKAEFNISETTFDYFTYSIAIPWKPIKGLVIKPNAYVTAYFQQKFRNATRYPVQVYGGLDLSYNFSP